MALDYRDRTREFNYCVESYRKRFSFGLVNPQTVPKGRHVEEFSEKAVRVLKDFDLTAQKLAKLRLIMKTKPAGASSDFARLAEIVQTDCRDSHKAILQLTDLLNASSTGRKSQILEHKHAMLLSLNKNLTTITGGLKSLVENNRELLTDAPPQPQQPPPAPTVYAQQQESRQPSYQQTSLLLAPPSRQQDHEVVHLQTQQFHAAPAQSQVFIPMVDQEVRQRETAMNRVEQTILQLGEMYQQFSTMVHEQAEMVTRIDTNTHEAYSNIEAAHVQLIMYLETISKNRRFMFKAFIVILVVFVIYAFVKR